MSTVDLAQRLEDVFGYNRQGKVLAPYRRDEVKDTQLRVQRLEVPA
jgi:hypothetical protein